MKLHSLALFALNLFTLVSAQDEAEPTALPAITGPAGGQGSCGGCYVVADIAGIYFASETLTITDFAYVSVPQGLNGTNGTVTTVATVAATAGVGQFSYNTGGLLTDTNGGAIALVNSTIITVNGATLTSPTAYEIITAFSVTSTVLSNGQCVVVPGTRSVVNPAFSVEVPDGAGAEFILEAENSFINSIGLLTCSAGGANMDTTSQVIVETLTSTSELVGPITLTPQPVSTAAASTAAATTEEAASTGAASTEAAASSTEAAAESSEASASDSAAETSAAASSTATSTITVSNIVIIANSTAIATGGFGTGTGIFPTQSFATFSGLASTSEAPSWLMWLSGLLTTLLAPFVL